MKLKLQFKNVIKLLKNRKYMSIFILCLLELGTLFLMYKASNNRTLDEVTLKQNKTNEIFAIFVEEYNGEYVKSEDNEFPDNYRYELNKLKSGCIDNLGNLINDALDYNFDTKVVSFKTNKTGSCYLYFDMLKDLTINVNTDGTDGELPETLGYTKTISCNNGSAPVWNYKYNRLEFSNVLGEEEVCNLTYTKDTSTYSTLKDTVEKDSEIVHEVYYKLHDDAAFTQLATEEDYGTITNTSKYPFAFDSTTGKWTDTATSAAMSYFKFYPKEAGYYQICYELPASQSENTSNSYKNYIAFATLNKTTGFTIKYSNAANGETVTGCYDYGYVSPDEYIYIRGRHYDNSVSFYAQKTDAYDVTETGYRYEGLNPNNYIWFNNEMWRIIGSIPTKVDEEGTMENLVKIIRKNSIGGISYEGNPTSHASMRWGYNSLSELLNGYYYGQKDNAGYRCIAYYNPSKSSTKTYSVCDYRTIGINPNDGYGKMIKNVYWNTGQISSSEVNPLTAYETYNKEIITQLEYKKKIGIMYISDYVFAAQNADHKTEYISNYNTDTITDSNWLYTEGNEWLLNVAAQTAFKVNYIGYDGSVNNAAFTTAQPKSVRPVVYLDSSVYIVSGDGTELDPYQIAMK